jgi:predicted Zn finger-like uncharacterized protein
MPTEDPPKMKIVCDSCGAKYSIADEKVAGKVFKIRCKKCSNTIVVRGDAPEHDDEEATRVFDHGAEAVWHVVVDGQQQGAYAPIQIAGLLSTARIDWDAYVWKEGFDGWLPLRQVDELVQAIGGEGPPAESGEASSEGAAQEPAAESPAEAPAAEDDPFASAGGEFSGGGEAEAAAAAPSQDLFGAAAADPFGGAAAASPFGESNDDVVSSPAPAASSPKVSEGQAMTGARNENSVLFSLSNLQALASPGGGSSTPSAASISRPQQQQAGAAQGDASGLIDIRNLASANAAVGAGGAKKESAEGAVDDLLSVGTGAGFGGGLGGSSALGGSSVLGGSSLLGGAVEEPTAAAAPQAAPKSSKLMPILGTVAVLGLGAAVVVLMMREPQQIVTVKETIIERAEPQPVAAPEPAAAAAEPEKAEEPEEKAAAAAKPSSTSSRTRTSSSSMTSSPSTSTMMAPSTTTSKPSSTANKDIGSLLDRAVAQPSSSTMSSSSSSSGSLPDAPDASAVRSALGGVAGAARACGNGTAGTARATVTFTGSTGRVSNVKVEGVPDPVAKCVERAVKSAKVPPFRRATFTAGNYPYRVQ